MAIIAPFCGLRYNPAKISRMEDVVTPPYDVIDEKAQQDYAEKNPYNMVQLDLSKHIDPGISLDERYAKAKALFETWQQERILIRDGAPAIYLYHIEYTHPSGRRLIRKGLVTLVQLAEFSEGIVKPHEKTFREVTGDRLRLLDTCKTQFSKIFSLYADENGKIITCLEKACPTEPLYSLADNDGNLHTVWAITEKSTINKVRELFRDKSLYIADGHHRYTTALQYRELLAKQIGSIAPESPVNFTMMCMTSMEDPGLSVLPTHRLVRFPGSADVGALTRELSQGFDLEEIKGASREVLIGELLARMDELSGANTKFCLYHPGEDRGFVMSSRGDAAKKVLAQTQPEELQDLDVVVLSEYVLGHLFGLGHERCADEKRIDYFSDPDEGLDIAVKESIASLEETPVLFLLNPTPVVQVQRVADAGLVMPHKSTYFYPKILTGLVMNTIIPEEEVA